MIVAVYHEVYAFFKKITETNKNFENLKNNFEKILLIMLPVLPHIANECLERLKFSSEIKWPDLNQKYIIKESNEIVIQVNGKKRNIILIEKDTEEDKILEKVKKTKLIEKYLKDKELIKTIYIKDRLINYIIK